MGHATRGRDEEDDEAAAAGLAGWVRLGWVWFAGGHCQHAAKWRFGAVVFGYVALEWQLPRPLTHVAVS